MLETRTDETVWLSTSDAVLSMVADETSDVVDKISVLGAIEDRTLEAMEEDPINEMDSVTFADEAIDEDTMLEETANEVLSMNVDDGTTVTLEDRLARLVVIVDETKIEELSNTDELKYEDDDDDEAQSQETYEKAVAVALTEDTDDSSKVEIVLLDTTRVTETNPDCAEEKTAET